MSHRASSLEGFGDEFAWSLLESVPDGVIVTKPSGDIVFASPRAAELFRCEVEDLLEISADDLLPEEARPAHRAERIRCCARPQARPMGSGPSLRARRLDGTEFDTEISLSPLSLGEETFVLAVVRDITERVAAEDHLHRVLRTLDASDDGLVMFDADTLRFTHVNDGTVRLLGYDRTELLGGMTPLHVTARACRGDYRDLIDRLLTVPDIEVRRVVLLLRKDGVEVPVEKTYRAAPVGRDGTRWIIATARDISPRLAAEAELRQHADALREAEQAIVIAEDRDRIAHDLHDTVIQRLFAAGLGLQSTMATVDGRARDRIGTAIQELDVTIRELRSAIFELQGGGPSVRGGCRSELLSIVNDVCDAAGLEARLQLDGDVETLDPAVAGHLAPTLREALSNVAEHAGARHVCVDISVDDREVCISVTDDGSGIDGEILGGNGIADVTARAESLGGSLRLTPGPDGGTRFLWTVPCAIPSASPHAGVPRRDLSGGRRG